MSALTRWQRTMWPELRERNLWTSPFADFFDRVALNGTPGEFPVDLLEEADSYSLRAELPGINTEDLKISVENDVITISAEKKDEFEGKDVGVYRRERCYGKYSRSFQLNGLVNPEKVDAEYKDGILTVSLPKREETKGRLINVKTK